MATQTAVKKGKKKTVTTGASFAVELREPGAGAIVRDHNGREVVRLEEKSKAKAGTPGKATGAKYEVPGYYTLPASVRNERPPAPTVPSLEDSFKAIYAGQPDADKLAAAAAKGREPGKLGQVYQAPPTSVPGVPLVAWGSSVKKEGAK